MAWLITPHKNIGYVCTDGLKASRADDTSRDLSRMLFSSLNDLISLGWGREFMGQGESYALIHVSGPRPERPCMVIDADIPASRVQVIALDIEGFAPHAAHHAMDEVEDPIADVESFAKTMVRMPAKEFGVLIGDAGFDDRDDMVRVYAGQYWIDEFRAEGAEPGADPIGHGVQVLSDYYTDFHMTGEDVSLKDLEARLLDLVREERDLPHLRAMMPNIEDPAP